MINPGKRKLITGGLLLGLGVLITFIKGDIPPNLKDLMEWTYIAFVLGNGFEYYSTMKTGRKPPRNK